jgi:hypothetical protein
MEEFNFEITLNYCMDTCVIKPPTSHTSLIQVASAKFDISKINKISYFDDDEEIQITSEADYLNLFDFVDSNQLKEIEIIIKSDQDKAKRKKSLRKHSKTLRAPIKQATMNIDDGCVNGKINLNFR